MKKILALLMFGFCSIALAIDPIPPTKTIDTPNGRVVLVKRDQLRAGPSTARIALNQRMRASLERKTIDVPKVWDWTKAHTIEFPILGNNQVGDCYYVALCHLVQAWTGNNGIVTHFDANKVMSRYRVLSGGDNGLGDSDVFPEFKRGIIGPDGPHKILDYATVSPTDSTAIALTQWAFGPHLYTCALLDTWLANAQPGALWTDKGTPDPYAGHAILLTAKNAKGNYSLETWGFNPPIEITPAGIMKSEPELISCFSLEWFNAKGYAPNGLHYTTLAPLWTSVTGHILPVSPFPSPDGPGPVVPPTPDPEPIPVPVPPTPFPPTPNPPIPVPCTRQPLFYLGLFPNRLALFHRCR